MQSIKPPSYAKGYNWSYVQRNSQLKVNGEFGQAKKQCLEEKERKGRSNNSRMKWNDRRNESKYSVKTEREKDKKERDERKVIVEY